MKEANTEPSLPPVTLDEMYVIEKKTVILLNQFVYICNDIKTTYLGNLGIFPRSCVNL